MREAPSPVMMETLWKAGANVQAHDRAAMDETRRIYSEHGTLKLYETKEETLEGAHGLVICTEWQHFRAPHLDLLADKLKDRVIFDGRNLYEPDLVKKHELAYYAIGRGDSVKKEN